jgi:ribonuclease HII
MKSFHTEGLIEAGCDEAGRGCLAGPVFAASVILPPDFSDDLIADSKKLSHNKRLKARELILKYAKDWAVYQLDNKVIDEVNILNASFLAMEKSVGKLKITPELLLIDGNRFRTKLKIPYKCIIKGDDKFYSIAAASILAKTFRDEYMVKISEEYPVYKWEKNKGYPTKEHQRAILEHGFSPYHRKSFHLKSQLSLF